MQCLASLTRSKVRAFPLHLEILANRRYRPNGTLSILRRIVLQEYVVLSNSVTTTAASMMGAAASLQGVFNTNDDTTHERNEYWY
jgi:hypothetical protein